MAFLLLDLGFAHKGRGRGKEGKEEGTEGAE